MGSNFDRFDAKARGRGERLPVDRREPFAGDADEGELAAGALWAASLWIGRRLSYEVGFSH